MSTGNQTVEFHSFSKEKLFLALAVNKIWEKPEVVCLQFNTTLGGINRVQEDDGFMS